MQILVNVAGNVFYRFSQANIKAHEAILNTNILTYITNSLFRSITRNDSKLKTVGVIIIIFFFFFVDIFTVIFFR